MIPTSIFFVGPKIMIRKYTYTYIDAYICHINKMYIK